MTEPECDFPPKLLRFHFYYYLFFGAILICTSIYGIATPYGKALIGAGFWTGLLFLIQGFIGLHIKRKGEENCFLVTFLSISIISVITSSFILIFSLLGIYCKTHIHVDPNGIDNFNGTLLFPEIVMFAPNLEALEEPEDKTRIFKMAPKHQHRSDLGLKPQHLILDLATLLKVVDQRPLPSLTSQNYTRQHFIKTSRSVLELPGLPSMMENGIYKDKPNEEGVSKFSTKIISSTRRKKLTERKKIKLTFSATILIYIIAAILSSIEFLVSILSTIMCCRAAFTRPPVGSNSIRSRVGSATLTKGDRNSGISTGPDNNKSDGNKKFMRIKERAKFLRQSVKKTNKSSIGRSRRKCMSSGDLPLYKATSPTEDKSILLPKVIVSAYKLATPLDKNPSIDQQHEFIDLARHKSNPKIVFSNSPLDRITEVSDADNVHSSTTSIANKPEWASQNLNKDPKEPSTSQQFQQSPPLNLMVEPEFSPQTGLASKKKSGRARAFLNPFRLTLKYDPDPPSVYLDLPSATELSSFNRTSTSYVYAHSPLRRESRTQNVEESEGAPSNLEDNNQGQRCPPIVITIDDADNSA